MNKTTTVEIKPSSNKTLSHTFYNISRGAVYEVGVSTNIYGAKSVSTVVDAPKLPTPKELRVWLEKNGTYVVYWKNAQDIHDEEKYA